MPLPKVKDPALLELETICKTRLAVPCSFIYADLYEANFGLDNLDPELEFPVFVHVANGKNKNGFLKTGEIQRTIPVKGYLLDRTDDATIDSNKSYEINDSINRMRQLGENLMYWINRSRLSVDGGVEKWNSDDRYQLFDANLHGQFLEFDWTVQTGSTGFYNTPAGISRIEITP